MHLFGVAALVTNRNSEVQSPTLEIAAKCKHRDGCPVRPYISDQSLTVFFVREFRLAARLRPKLSRTRVRALLPTPGRCLPQLCLDAVPAQRFHQMIVKSSSRRAPPIKLLSPTGLSDEDHCAAPGTSPDPTTDFVAIHVRHAEVEQRDMRSEFFRYNEALL